VPFAAQAAEIHLRRHLGLRGISALELVSHADGETLFRRGDEAWRVRVTQAQSDPQLLTCRARRANPAAVHELVALGRV
jgi:hypothetical protein